MAAPLQVHVSYRQIIRIAAPISLALLVPQLNFIINNVFLGHYSGEALATASITGVYYLVFSSIGYGLNNGLQILIARKAGENNPDEIGRLFTQGILIAGGIALLGILLTYTVAPAILRGSLHSPEVAEASIRFLNIRIWGLPFLFIYQMRNALLVGTNQSRYLVAGTLAETAANVLFDYLFIFGAYGFPALGFNGAAYASILAEFIGMFVIFLVIRAKGITRRFSLFRSFTVDKARVRSILNISAPLIFQHGISVVSWVFFYILVEHHGTTASAVSNTMRNIFGFFGVFIWAFAATTNSMVSNVIGQGRADEVIQLVGKIIRLSFGLALVIFVLLNAVPEWYLSIYGQEGEFIRTGVPVLRVVSVGMLLMSFATVWLNAVTGTGKSRVTFLIELVTIILYSVYVYAVLEWQHLSIVWGWMSEWLYWLLLFSLSYWYLRKGKWKPVREEEPGLQTKRR
ncbi:MAG TPA: MATE family efflux transporter [Chitinophagaceae bacterium]|nr:MATE family efflux transporter [Chitinophagaceae bacterium]